MAVNNIDLSGIKRFNKFLKKTLKTNQDDKKNEKIEKISAIAYNELSIAYSSTVFQVQRPEINNTKCTIYVKGEEIAFDEFGTGLYARGSYKGNLPKQPIQFESVGFPQVTVGWTYYYRWQGNQIYNPKAEVNGVFGWFTKNPKGAHWRNQGKTFHKGQKASNRFYNAVQNIKKEIKENK